jgi:hypothetical protein
MWRSRSRGTGSISGRGGGIGDAAHTSQISLVLLSCSGIDDNSNRCEALRADGACGTQRALRTRRCGRVGSDQARQR